MKYEIHNSDCLSFMRGLPSNHVDAIVTDPPYGLSFMGKKWDYDVPSEEIWRECLRVLKPGGHLLAFAGTRTQHRMCVRIEDAGFEIRDMIAWVYGSGFPKSLDVSKAIDKAAGAKRERLGTKVELGVIHSQGHANKTMGDGWRRPWRDNPDADAHFVTAPATDAARQWQGWGTALKPALEPITVARKPLIGTVAENVLTWGTGALNVDGCRVALKKGDQKSEGGELREKKIQLTGKVYGTGHITQKSQRDGCGRWPANLIHDGSEEVVGLFPETKATGRPNCIGKTYKGVNDGSGEIYNDGYAERTLKTCNMDSGSAARFFYCAKASKRDRDEGCEGMEAKKASAMTGIETRQGKPTNHPVRTNHHPTVKPTDLMRYLCRLVTPPNGIVFDPFMGSGSTGKAAVLEGFNFIGCDMTADYVDIARARIEHALNTKPNTLF